MTLRIKSIMSCLVILTTGSNIQTQQIRELGSAQQLARGISLVWGNGVKPSQLPIIVYSPYSTSLDVSVYIIEPKKQCNFKFFLGKGTSPNVEAIRQLGNNRVAIHWSNFASLHKQEDTVVTTISILDMGTCFNKKILELSWDSSSKNILRVVPFVDGFDVITSTNSHARYDIDGNLIGKTETFPIHSISFSISSVSTKLRKNGFFIADYDNAALNLVKVNGTFKKLLLKPIPAEVFTNNEQSLFSVCLFDADVVNCHQYDENGNEWWNSKTKIGFSGVLDVKNLAGGGLVFAAWNFKDNRLSFAEIGPKKFYTWSYLAKHPFQTARLMDFNENEHTFDLAYSQIVQQVPEESLMLQKFSLGPPKSN